MKNIADDKDLKSNSVSVIIPTYNRPKTLMRVIESYIKQSYVQELIIIDDGSTKKYSEVLNEVEKLIEIKNIRLIYKKNGVKRGAAYCRNLGISLANCEYILWGEDDAFLSDNYVSLLMEKGDDQDIVFGSIYYDITPEMTYEEKEEIMIKQQNVNKPIFDYDIFEGYYRRSTNGFKSVPFGHALILVPKCAYRNVEYFEAYKVNGYREESDAQVQMVKNGYRILYHPKAISFHFPRKQIENGGQHNSSILRHELYKILNNNKFLDRHYDFFNKEYRLNISKFKMKVMFMMNIIKTLRARIVRKIKG